MEDRVFINFTEYTLPGENRQEGEKVNLGEKSLSDTH